MNLRFYESLAALNQEAVRICEHLQESGQIHKYFLRNGFVKIVINEQDSPLRVNHPDVLWSKFVVPDTLRSKPIVVPDI